MRYVKIILILLASLTLTNCANRSHTGAVLGAGTGTMACLEYISDNPYIIATCAVGAAFAGAEIMYNSDKDVHNAVFVDHLNTSDYGTSYTNWYNAKTGNSGIIHITKSYMEGPFKCKDYDHTIDITNQWPLIGVGGVNREVVFGTACQLPDGRWVEKP
jgi:surface antigen|tara:strand:- start:8164 stop:8640 length:477 start_codon:yes stop_codon:yes gene_type:complete